MCKVPFDNLKNLMEKINIKAEKKDQNAFKSNLNNDLQIQERKIKFYLTKTKKILFK